MTSTLIVILGPLFLIIFAAFAFNTAQLQGLVIGIIDNDLDNKIISNDFLNHIENEGYSYERFNSVENCNLELKKSNVHVCIEEKSNIIRFFVEPSRLNLVYVMLNSLSSIIDDYADEIKYTLTSNLVEKISDIEDFLLISQEYIQDILNETYFLNDNIDYLSEEIVSLEIDVNLDSIDIQEIKITNTQNKIMIFDYEEKVISQITNSIEKLNLFDDIAKKIEMDIEENKELRKEIEQELNEAYDDFDCNNYESYNLLEKYSESETLEEIINELERPECSFIITISSALDQCTGDLNQASDDVNLIRYEINQGKSELLNFKDESYIVFNETKYFLEEIDRILNSSEEEIQKIDSGINNIEFSKSELLQKMEGINIQLTQNKELIHEFSDGLNQVYSEIKEVKGVSSNELLNPIINQVEGFDKSKSNIDYLFPTLLIFIIMFVGILLGNILISKEKKSNAFFRNIISPTHNLIIPFGTFLSCLLIIFLQIIIVFILSFLFLPITINILFIELLIILILSISLFVSIGILLGNLIESEETSIIIAILLSIVLLIFSNLFVPIEAMPTFFSFIVNLNPFFIVSEILSKHLINQISLISLYNHFLKLLFFTFIFFALSMYSYHKKR